VRQLIRLHIIAEGQTEERFVKDTLSEYLGKFQISTDVRCVYTSKDKNRFYRGGLVSYQKARKDIQAWLKEDANPDARFTTMFDLYALPGDFPLYKESKSIINPYQKVQFLENALKKMILTIYVLFHTFNSMNLKHLYLQIQKILHLNILIMTMPFKHYKRF